jgi:cell division protein FtsZ
LIVIPNQKVMEVVTDKSTLLEAFKIADSVLNKGTKAIADLITVPGLINLDFADIKSVMSNAGSALMGVGEAEGENRAQKAIEAAIDSPLVEATIEGARGVLINVTGGPDLTMSEIEDAAKNITERAAPDANIIFGATIDNELKGKIKISVIATGFDNTKTHFYQSLKKPIIESIPVSQPSTSQVDNSPKEISNQEIKKFLGDKDIPAGIDIIDEFDIPAFLRKKN